MAKTVNTDEEINAEREAKGTAEGIDGFFRSTLSIESMAKSFGNLPEVVKLLRTAGVQDARKSSGVRMTAARVAGIRAKALGDKKGMARAAARAATAERLAKAAYKEECRPTGGEPVFDKIAGMAGLFQLRGQVLDEEGAPVPNAKVVLKGRDSGVLAEVSTDKAGEYDLSLPIGKDKDQGNEGEPLEETVTVDDKTLSERVIGFAKEGTLAHQVLTLPVANVITDLAAPIVGRRLRKAFKSAPAKTAKGKTATSKQSPDKT